MNTAGVRLADPFGGVHPALLSRRVRTGLISGLSGLLVGGVALGVSVAVPKPNPVLIAALMVGSLGILFLLLSPRYEVTVGLVVIYLSMLDGPVKLLTASRSASAVRDVLIFSVVVGMLGRLSLSRQQVTAPPLSGWVFLFVLGVLVQAFNPQTHNILKVLGGFRQELEWIPFFFFGYLLLRSSEGFRKLFLVLGVMALANGLVGAYQSRLSPQALGTWGPGYNERINGSEGTSAPRTVKVEGEGRDRPPGLGSNSGFSGSMGVVALPGLLAMLAAGRVRRRWVVMLLAAGALLGVATSASRTSLVIAVIALLSYAGFSVIAGLRVGRPLIALLAVLGLAVGVAAGFEAYSGNGIFKRQETVPKALEAESSGGKGGDSKVQLAAQLPREIFGHPLGSGLGTGAAAGGFGGKAPVTIEGQGASAQAGYNLVVFETGLAGLILFLGLAINVLLLAVRRLRSVQDVEVRTYLVAILAAYLAFTAAGFSGPTLAVFPGGTFLWFAPGVIAYWLAGPGRTAPSPIAGPARTAARPTLAASA
jgi:hypothetical protein